MAPRETVDVTIDDGPLLTLLSQAPEKHQTSRAAHPVEPQTSKRTNSFAKPAISPDAEIDHLAGREITNYHESRSFYVIAPADAADRIWEHEADLPGNTLVAAIRHFMMNGERTLLLVRDGDLKAFVVKEEALKRHARPARDQEIQNSDFAKTFALTRERVIDRIRDDITAQPALSFVLTVDLCQSRRTWDQDLFDRLLALSDLLGRPLDVGIAITGKWALRHKHNFGALKRWSAQGKLNITWINHSMNHPLRPDRFGNYHFLTDKEVDLRNDVLSLEVLLLENGITPSIWFRFPGLVYDRRVLRELNDLSLLALDANVWLANAARITDGAVVLVHGNGNERAGLRKLFRELDKHQGKLLAAETEILPARAALPIGRSDAPLLLSQILFR